MNDKSNEDIQAEDHAEPTKRKLNSTQKLIEVIHDKIAPSRHVPHEDRLAQLTPEQKVQLQFIEDTAISNFIGMLDELESALGMLRIGHHFGWRTLYILHSKKTIRKYEEILNIKIRDIFPEEGPSADRSIGLALAKRASNFWKAVSGEYKIENRREIK
ncbi:hypothetical protein [Methylotenera sp.]|uniref:hypothetical protein n=1 Tax=Methylotenera sp. TaxID=2051956 RepID=UPI0027332A2C|nr:hypothetical protein [Methylotenera sp.]MDP3308976.1 hypothetical protein [Methylotenera sp.]